MTSQGSNLRASCRSGDRPAARPPEFVVRSKIERSQRSELVHRAAQRRPLIGIMWVTFGHLRPAGHIMPDHAGDRGAVFMVLAPSITLLINHDRTSRFRWSTSSTCPGAIMAGEPSAAPKMHAGGLVTNRNGFAGAPHRVMVAPCLLGCRVLTR
jgi:hypothetical protein